MVCPLNIGILPNIDIRVKTVSTLDSNRDQLHLKMFLKGLWRWVKGCVHSGTGLYICPTYDIVAPPSFFKIVFSPKYSKIFLFFPIYPLFPRFPSFSQKQKNIHPDGVRNVLKILLNYQPYCILYKYACGSLYKNTHLKKKKLSCFLSTFFKNNL